MAVGIITSKEMTNCLFSSASYGHPHYCVFVMKCIMDYTTLVAN
jgi:hypothetical protein